MFWNYFNDPPPLPPPLPHKNFDCKVCKDCTISFERPEASPLNVYSPSAIIGLSLLNSILMVRFLKQSLAQTCLKEMDNGKLQQFDY